MGRVQARVLRQSDWTHSGASRSPQHGASLPHSEEGSRSLPSWQSSLFCRRPRNNLAPDSAFYLSVTEWLGFRIIPALLREIWGFYVLVRRLLRTICKLPCQSCYVNWVDRPYVLVERGCLWKKCKSPWKSAVRL